MKESGFEILNINWINYNEFIIELKLIDEEGIYTGVCELVVNK